MGTRLPRSSRRSHSTIHAPNLIAAWRRSRANHRARFLSNALLHALLDTLLDALRHVLGAEPLEPLARLALLAQMHHVNVAPLLLQVLGDKAAVALVGLVFAAEQAALVEQRGGPRSPRCDARA